MAKGRWERIKDVVGMALAVPAEQRAQVIHAACEGDAELEAEVADLVARSGATEFFAAPVAAFDAWHAASVWVGRQLGAYRIAAELSSGGMGRVFEAHRADGQYDSRVAIKILRASIDTAEGRSRFNVERNILAKLQHPHIASLIDGGTTDGLPYFVMEYVNGMPIDRYCGEQALGLRARLELFCKVCMAVEFAHQQLIVHRDLKPENILVTGAAVPKLLDFGIAKLLDTEQWGADQGLTMLDTSGPYTPAYAAPEQLQGQAITTGTDVYALGGILYRLLTGRLPFDLESARGAAWVQATCERVADRPSVALQRPANSDDALIRQGLPALAPLAASLRGDLDLVVCKALEKDTAERYRTVAQLHADIRSYLDGRAVSARRPSFAYLARKFIARNRAYVALGVLAGVAVLAGVSGVLWQAHVAQTMRLRAENRMQDVQQLSEKMVFEYSDQIMKLAGGLKLSQQLMQDLTGLLNKLQAEQDLPIRTRIQLGLAYQRLAAAQGAYRSSSLGDGQLAAKNRNQAYAIMNGVLQQLERDPALLPATEADADKMSRWKFIMHVADLEREFISDSLRLSQFETARAHMERALKLTELAAVLRPSQLEVGTVVAEQAQLYAHHFGNYREALRLVRRAQALALELLGQNARNTQARYLLANTYIAEAQYQIDGFGARQLGRASFMRGIEQDRLLHAANKDDASYLHVLVGDLLRVGNLDLADRNFDSAYKLIDEAETLFAPHVVVENDNQYARYVSGHIARSKAEYFILTGQTAAAEAESAKLHRVVKLLLSRDEKSSDNIYLSAAATTIDARILLIKGKLDASAEENRRSMALIAPIAKLDSGMYRRLLSSQIEYAELLNEHSHWARSIATLDAVRAFPQPVAGKKETYQFLHFCVRMHLALGVACLRQSATLAGSAQTALLERARQHFAEVRQRLQPAIESGNATPQERAWYGRASPV